MCDIEYLSSCDDLKAFMLSHLDKFTLGKFADEAFGVELPAYIREELITTLK